MRVLAVLVLALFSTQLFADNKGKKEVKELERQLQEKKFSKHYNCFIDGIQVSAMAALEAVPFMAAMGAVKVYSKAPKLVPSGGVFFTDGLHDVGKAQAGALLGENRVDDMLINLFLGAGSIYVDVYKHGFRVLTGDAELGEKVDLHYTKKNFSGTIAASKDLLEPSGREKSLRCIDLHKEVDSLESSLAEVDGSGRSESNKVSDQGIAPLYKKSEVLAN